MGARKSGQRVDLAVGRPVGGNAPGALERGQDDQPAYQCRRGGAALGATDLPTRRAQLTAQRGQRKGR